MLFDLLKSCPILVEQISRRAVGFGINHAMRDFRTARRKSLDLVVCTPGAATRSEQITLGDLKDHFEIQLSAEEAREFRNIPVMHRVTVGSVHLALEAKACMTAHIKALPRLYDELNSSHAAIHGSADFAIASGFAMVNLGKSFISPDRNRVKIGPRQSPVVTQHTQPRDTERTIEKVKEIPRRVTMNTEGFDAIGIVVVRMANDGTPVTLIADPPAPSDSDPWHYDQMIRRMASLYASKFGNI